MNLRLQRQGGPGHGTTWSLTQKRDLKRRIYNRKREINLIEDRKITLGDIFSIIQELPEKNSWWLNLINFLK